MKRVLTLSAFLLMAGGVTGVIQARGTADQGGWMAAGGHRWDGPHHGRANHPHRNRLADLDLSQEQQDRIASVRDARARDMVQKRADLQLARLDLRQLLRSEKPDQRAINAQIDRMAAIQADMQKSRVGARLEIRSILTDGQRAKLREPRSNESEDSRENDPRRP